LAGVASFSYADVGEISS